MKTDQSPMFTYKPYTYAVTPGGVKLSVLSALAYYDLFSFPLTKEEILLFMDQRCQPDLIQVTLTWLAQQKLIYKLGDYYALKNEPYLVLRREAGTEKAMRLLNTARKISRFLIKFPYVRGVAVSGSLSKKYADSNSDIDLFIITAPNRLWIARTLLHAFKKMTFMVNKQHYFCMNYFVDEQHAEIVEKNLFTATETVTLMPLQGDLAFEKFYSRNIWTREYLPNHLMRVSSAETEKKSVFKYLVEVLFNKTVGNLLDNWLMDITAKRWEKKTNTGCLNSRGILMSMKAAKWFAKPDPTIFQNRIMENYNHNITVLKDTMEHAVV